MYTPPAYPVHFVFPPMENPPATEPPADSIFYAQMCTRCFALVPGAAMSDHLNLHAHVDNSLPPAGTAPPEGGGEPTPPIQVPPDTPPPEVYPPLPPDQPPPDAVVTPM